MTAITLADSVTELDISLRDNQSFFLDLVVQQADSEGTLAPIDTTGYSASMFIRDTAQSTATLMEITSAKGWITFGGTDGGVNILVPYADIVSGVVFSTGVYDLLVTDTSGRVFAVIQGTITVVKGVTKL